MLQQVILQTAEPTTLKINDVDPESIIIVESISGLDPAKVTNFTGDFARDGGYYQGRRSSGRNPVFNLKLNPNYADDIEVSDIREMLYDWFLEPSPTSDQLRVVLQDDRKPDRYFDGVVEDFPADLFSRDTKAQISMLCVDPYFRSVDEVIGHDDVGWVSTPVTYEGSKRIGLEMVFRVTTDTVEMNVDINGVRFQVYKPSGTFEVDDVITINTEIGKRRVDEAIDPDDPEYEFGTNTERDVMAQIGAGSRWPELNKGVNTIKTYGGVEADGKVVMTDYKYRAAWWGI